MKLFEGKTTDLSGESRVESYVKVAGDDAERPAREEEEQLAREDNDRSIQMKAERQAQIKSERLPKEAAEQLAGGSCEIKGRSRL